MSDHRGDAGVPAANMRSWWMPIALVAVVVVLLLLAANFWGGESDADTDGRIDLEGDDAATPGEYRGFEQAG